jgi:hypothetical protein
MSKSNKPKLAMILAATALGEIGYKNMEAYR